MKNLHGFEQIRANCKQLCAKVKAEKAAKVEAAKPIPETVAKPYLKKHNDPYFSGFYPFPAKMSTFGSYIDRIFKKYSVIYGAFAVFIVSSILMGVASAILTGFATIIVLVLALTAGYHWWTYLDEHTALNNIERNFAVVRSLTVLK